MAAIKDLTGIEHSAARLTIVLSRTEVQSEYNKFLAEVLKDIQLPGFRRGKVPREVLEHKAGDALKEDILARVVGGATKSILEKEDFPQQFAPLPYADPRLEGEPALDLEREFEFSVVYDIKPEVKIEKCEKLTIEVPDAVLNDDDIKRELEALRERNAVVIDRGEGEKSQKGDVVTVNYCEIGEDGAPLPATQREDFVFELGTKRNLYQFDDEITGMKSGAERDFEKRYPANFGVPELAGTTKKLRVKVTAVKKKELPLLDDEFAQDVDEKYHTLSDLKKDLHVKMQRRLEDQLTALKNDAIIKKIAGATPFELPQTMIDYDIAEQMYSMMGRLPEGGIHQLLSENQELAGMFRQRAEERIRARLIIDALLQKNPVAVGDADIEAEYARFAERSGESIEKVKDYFAGNKAARQDTEQMIKERKLFEWLASKNTIKKGKKGHYLDIVPHNA